MLKAFRVLARCRTIRNTWLDPFARTRERRLELAWLHSYEAVLDEIAIDLCTENLALATQLAELPDAVRGYGPVKDRYLEQAIQQKDRLLKQWREGTQFHELGSELIRTLQL